METTESRDDATRVATKALAITLIVGWLALVAWAAGALLMVASLSVATFFGEAPTGENWVEGIGFSLAGVIAAAAGPLGVWVFHRRRGWLIAAGWAALVTGVVALFLLISFSSG